MTIKEWRDKARELFPDGLDTVAFRCPSCGHVATVAEYRAAKAPDGAIGFSCIGRWLNASDKNTFRAKGGPCQYAGGGLICINPVAVAMPDGKVDHFFDFAGEEVRRAE